MKQTIRPYSQGEFEMVASWWKAQKEFGPDPDMMPSESSFIVEIGGVPAAAITVYLPNTKAFAMLDNLVGNPEVKGPWRKEAINSLINHCKNFAREHGYKRLFCMAYRDKLVSRYQEFGFHPTLVGVTTMAQGI